MSLTEHEKLPAPAGHAGADDLGLAPDDRKAAERRLVRKMDAVLMPLLTVTLGLQYYDKAALGSAAAFGILKDLVSLWTSPCSVLARSQ